MGQSNGAKQQGKTAWQIILSKQRYANAECQGPFDFFYIETQLSSMTMYKGDVIG